MQGKVPAPAGKLPQRPSQAFRTTASGMPRGTRRCGASGSWGSAEIVRDSVVVRRDCRVWSAEWGASLVLGRDVSAESLDVRTGKTSELLVHWYRTLKIRKRLPRSGSDLR